MTATGWAIATLACYVLLAVGAVWRTLRGYSTTLRESLFTLVLRSYIPFVFNQRVVARCPWPLEGTALIVANHSSPTDPVVIHSASLHKTAGKKMRIVEWLTAREYCERGGPVELLCNIARCIPVDRSGRDMAAVRAALRRAKAGSLIGIFPEGGLNDGRSLKEFQTGVAFLALSGKLPVYPVFIENAPRGSTMVTSFMTTSQTRVYFGQEVDLDDFRAKRRPSPEDLEAATARIRDAVAQLGGLPLDSEAVAGRIGLRSA